MTPERMGQIGEVLEKALALEAGSAENTWIGSPSPFVFPIAFPAYSNILTLWN